MSKSTIATEHKLLSLKTALSSQGYVADDTLLSSLHLMTEMQKPLLIEGEAGVGKTEIASCLAKALNKPLIRLQCYEGLDAQHALYDWDYQRQMLAIQMAKSGNTDDIEHKIYTDQYLIKRPLFKAISTPEPAVLLIDEIDRADQEFEALLLELLSDFQISVPEIGTIKATSKPHVILTSNGIRDISDALRRRCLFHYLEYPDAEKERNILNSRVPGIEATLRDQIVAVVNKLRTVGLRKTPGVAETIDWASALLTMDINNLQSINVTNDPSLSSLIKTQADLQTVKTQFADLYASINSTEP